MTGWSTLSRRARGHGGRAFVRADRRRGPSDGRTVRDPGVLCQGRAGTASARTASEAPTAACAEAACEGAVRPKAHLYSGRARSRLSIGIQKGPPIGAQKGSFSRRCRNDISASGRCQSRPKPRGGTIAWSSVRSRSQIACNASAVALSCRFSGSASSQAAY